ncbi:MAG: NTP transferase domain-containing protein [Firmicutes bacterium]|nr:NTP transferase domain-containing protein [Bacillota bacterium]
MSRAVAALVLAGAPNEGPLRAVSDCAYEALIEVAGRPMVEYVLDALRAAPSVGPIGIVGPVADLKAAVRLEGEELIEPAGGLLDNVARGAERLTESGDRLLVVTGDIPLLTPGAVEDFLARCRRRPAGLDACYPMVSREVAEAQFPGQTRTYVRLREGLFTGGNCVLLSPEVLLRQRSLFEQAVALRKNPVGMARLLGAGFIVSFLLKRLSAADIERVIRDRLGINGAIIAVPHAEIGFDVDKPADLELARRMLEDGRPGTG